MYRRVLGDGRSRIVKVDRAGWTVVAREQVAFPALRAQGLVEFPEVEFTQADLADPASTFMVMPETKSVPAEELWRRGQARHVVARSGDFLWRLAVVSWQSILKARSPEHTSQDVGSWFRDWFAPLLAAPWWTAAAQAVADESLLALDAPPGDFGGWQFGQLLTDAADEFTVIDWTNLGAYWSLNDLASTIASLSGYHPDAPATLEPVHTYRRRVLPFTTARTRWMFGFQRRQVLPWMRRRMAFLPSRGTLFPKPGCLPHSSQTEPISTAPVRADAGTTLASTHLE